MMYLIIKRERERIQRILYFTKHVPFLVALFSRKEKRHAKNCHEFVFKHTTVNIVIEKYSSIFKDFFLDFKVMTNKYNVFKTKNNTSTCTIFQYNLSFPQQQIKSNKIF